MSLESFKVHVSPQVFRFAFPQQVSAQEIDPMNSDAFGSPFARTVSFFVLLVVSLVTAQLALAPLTEAQNQNPSAPVLMVRLRRLNLLIPIRSRADGR